MANDDWLMGALAASDAYRGDDPAWPPAPPTYPGMSAWGNIDLDKRPVVRNADGSISTVRSMGVNFGDGETLIPTVSQDGRVMGDEEAVDYYRKTGQHLGKFDTPENADFYAQKLHEQQADQYLPQAAPKEESSHTGPQGMGSVLGMGTLIPPPRNPAAPPQGVVDMFVPNLSRPETYASRSAELQPNAAGKVPTSDPFTTGAMSDLANMAGYAMPGPGGAAKAAAVLGLGVGRRLVVPAEEAAAKVAGMGSLADASKYIQPGETRVSTRFPTAVGATEDPLRQHLSIGLEEMKASPGYEKNINVLSGYPGFAHLEAMGTDEAARAYIRQAAGNLDYLYRRSPEVMKQRSPLWYEGAHEISDALAKRWGVPRPSSSAALASLSPQMDWFKNASLGERTGDIMTSAAAGRPMTSEMEAMARSPKMRDLFAGERTGDVNREMLQKIRGKSFDQLTEPYEQALWLRLRDEAHNPRAYRTITPEGNFGDFVLKKDGTPARVGWGGLGEIQKAIVSLKSGGDMNIISPALGNMHKVRSFYNNIENPHYPLFGDVTADTHQVAGAQLRPLSGSSPAVEHNLSGSMGASSSALSGVRGTYGLTADATRMMAAEHGLMPRAGQSATWEPVRELFTKEWKTPENANKVDNIWRAYDRGDISIEQARDAIFETAGGIGTPGWARPDLKVFAPTQGSTYR